MAETPSTRQLNAKNWHTFELEDVYKELETDASGLTSEEARRRLAEYGPNTLPARDQPTIWQVLLQQLLHPLIFILFAAALASMLIGETIDALFILIVIVLNTGLGTYQE